MNKDDYRLKSIDNGTAIDHIPKGKALQLVNVLEIGEEITFTMAVNVPSKRVGRKDIILIEGKELNEKEFAKIGLIAIGSTINIVRNKKVIEKFTAKIPKEANGIIKCNNPNCITNIEKINTKFKINSSPLEAKCGYCERFMKEEEILKQIK
ncbi:MAG TPA: aspartate carbamoyltransferase regulatory subunit [archaeon]|nr:aspartate carbamoyltransferase regulatory subunit [archaeon]